MSATPATSGLEAALCWLLAPRTSPLFAASYSLARRRSAVIPAVAPHALCVQLAEAPNIPAASLRARSAES